MSKILLKQFKFRFKPNNLIWDSVKVRMLKKDQKMRMRNIPRILNCPNLLFLQFNIPQVLSFLTNNFKTFQLNLKSDKNFLFCIQPINLV